ncbi:DUF4160 domain-containing protein [Mycolicibacterium austroafricanum]|uniref:DUF4160 domain-containing protein n=1 Tax=Mycolicibacterium austroafricanum TaxID=39687 RepID=UPI00056CDEE5|nr:DUF4160 domain-containing protein [Mycolicibacterium austroafricanum]
MPRIAEFFGIVIYMYAYDHPEPHFHATYAGDEARYAISDGQLIEGELPKSQDKKVREWAQAHREQLSRNWDLCESGQAPERIS